MPEEQLKKIADDADFIVAGYSFTKNASGNISVLSLDDPQKACVLTPAGEMLETSMNDADLCVVQAYYLRNKEFMEAEDA